jgi:predicted Zn-dependent protease
MQTDWEGYYLDGKTATRQRAAVRLLRTRLEISPANGPTVWWPYGEIRQTQGFYAGQEIRLERGGELPEAVLLRDPAFLTSLHRVAPETAGRFHDPSRRRMRVSLTALAALAAVCAAAALYVWGIPGAATVVAPHIPVSWEEHLGRTVSEQLAPAEKRCAEATRLHAIQAIVTTLASVAKTSPYTFRVVVLNTPAVNALATPGGYIVVFRGLLERTESAEELAGVLAHEFQHVLLQHATRALLRHASTGILLAAVSGDVSGAMAYGLEGARVLAELRYSRQDEEEADREGYRMLSAAGVDPAGMMRFFETLQKKAGKAPTLPSYLSTHPSTEGRIERLRSLGATARPAASRLLPNLDWRNVRDICSATGPLHP